MAHTTGDIPTMSRANAAIIEPLHWLFFLDLATPTGSHPQQSDIDIPQQPPHLGKTEPLI